MRPRGRALLQIVYKIKRPKALACRIIPHLLAHAVCTLHCIAHFVGFKWQMIRMLRQRNVNTALVFVSEHHARNFSSYLRPWRLGSAVLNVFLSAFEEGKGQLVDLFLMKTVNWRSHEPCWGPNSPKAQRASILLLLCTAQNWTVSRLQTGSFRQFLAMVTEKECSLLRFKKLHTIS